MTYFNSIEDDPSGILLAYRETVTPDFLMTLSISMKVQFEKNLEQNSVIFLPGVNIQAALETLLKPSRSPIPNEPAPNPGSKGLRF